MRCGVEAEQGSGEANLVAIAGGLEVVEFVRSQDAMRSLPILIVTTRGDDASRTAVMKAGASRFMTKPFTPEALLAEAQSMLAARGSTP